MSEKNMDRISKSIIAQIIAYMFFTLSFFLIIYDNDLIYISSLLGIGLLSGYLLYFYRIEWKR